MPTAQQNSTLTMYFCGSGNNMTAEKTNKHAVPKLINMARNRHIGYDGPGGNPCGNAIYKMAPDGIRFDLSGEAKQFTNAKTSKWYNKLKGAKNGANGYGVGNTIKAAVNWLHVMMSEYQSKPFTDINLCGHSRGSVTAVTMAWAIQRILVPRLPNIRVNMFLFDPVAGGIHRFEDSYNLQKTTFSVKRDELPPCVASFRGLMAANMCGSLKFGLGKKDEGFESTMPAAGNCLDYKVYVMPGGHNSATKYNVLNEGSQIGRIGMHLAQTFLETHGSQFHGSFKLSGPEILECYAVARNPMRGARTRHAKFEDIDNDLKFFSDSGNSIASVNRLAALPDSTLFGHDFWVNNHHREIFSAMYPSLAYKLDNGKISINEMNRIKMSCPETALLTAVTQKVETMLY